MKCVPVICIICFLVVLDIFTTHQNPIQQLDSYLSNSEYSSLEIDDRLINSRFAGGESTHTFTSRYRNQCEKDFLRTHDDLDTDSIDYCEKNPKEYAPMHWKYTIARPDDKLAF